MSEDYKKIAFEDVKVGQRVRVVEEYTSHIATYEGHVLEVDIEVNEIGLGEDFRDVTTVYDVCSVDTYILLLEDVPKPKVVRTETVTITHYDDGTTTQVPVEESRVPTRIETVEQFEEYEDYLKQVVLKDCEGDYWTYRDGHWCWVWYWAITNVDGWNTTTGSAEIKANLPLTVVENIGD